MDDVVLATARLHLRLWRDGDLAQWIEHLNTPEVKRHIGGVQTPERVAESFAKCRQAWADDGFSFLAIERAEDGAFIGTCGLARIATAAAPDELRGGVQVGWQLRSDCWGHGYATEAARAMVGFGFANHAFPAIWAQTSENNMPSWRVMQRLGMQRRADLDYDDPDYPPQDNPTMIWMVKEQDWWQRA